MNEFEKQLIDVMNSSSLPMEAKLYVLMHVYTIADAEYRKVLTEEQRKREKALTESANDVGGADGENR